jgi:hypothetical protein
LIVYQIVIGSRIEISIDMDTSKTTRHPVELFRVL